MRKIQNLSLKEIKFSYLKRYEKFVIFRYENSKNENYLKKWKKI